MRAFPHPIPSPRPRRMAGLILLVLLPATAWAGKGTLFGPTGILGDVHLEGNPETLVFEWCNGDKVR